MGDEQNLETELDRLHQCILAGDFAQLPRLAEAIERLLAELAPISDRLSADRLSTKATRNGMCLQAAARGFRAAQRRMIEVRAITTQIATYTNLGQRAEINTGVTAITKRL